MVDCQPTKLHKVNGKNDFLLAPKIGKMEQPMHALCRSALIGWEIKRTDRFPTQGMQPQMELLMCGAKSNKPFIKVPSNIAKKHGTLSLLELCCQSPKPQVLTNMETVAVVFYYVRASSTIKNRPVQRHARSFSARII